MQVIYNNCQIDQTFDILKRIFIVLTLVFNTSNMIFINKISQYISISNTVCLKKSSGTISYNFIMGGVRQRRCGLGHIFEDIDATPQREHHKWHWQEYIFEDIWCPDQLYSTVCNANQKNIIVAKTYTTLTTYTYTTSKKSFTTQNVKYS